MVQKSQTNHLACTKPGLNNYLYQLVDFFHQLVDPDPNFQPHSFGFSAIIDS